MVWVCFEEAWRWVEKNVEFKVVGRRRARTKMTWRRHLEEHIEQFGLKKEDAANRTKLGNAAYELSRNMKLIWPPPSTETKPDLINWISLSLSLY